MYSLVIAANYTVRFFSAQVRLECEGQRERWEGEAVKRAREEWEREKDRVVGEAVRQARVQWLEGRET